MATIESLQAQVIALQASEAKLTAENEKLTDDIDDAVELHFADLKLREVTHKEWDTLQDVIAELEAENEKLTTEIVEVKKDKATLIRENTELGEGQGLTSEFWECLMDCRGKHIDNPDKQEIDEWCVAYDKSDEIRLSIYEEVGIDEEDDED
mgnify:CR=1 FL=1